MRASHRLTCSGAAVVIGSLVALSGLVVAAAWHFHVERLIQFDNGQVLMQFNTALGLAVAGTGLALAAAGWRRAASCCGLFALVLGALTVAQYLFEIGLDIDQLLMNAYIKVPGLAPGRMAPQTALGFMLVGLALVGLGRHGTSALGIALAGAGAMLTTALALLAVSCYLGEVEPVYDLLDFTRMTLPTALALIALSTGLALLGWMRWQAEPALPRIWLPLAIATATVTVAVGMWLALLGAEHAHHERMAREEMGRFVSLVLPPVETRMHALERMARRWAFRGGIPQAEWEADAHAYLLEKEGFFRAIEWVDRDQYVRWVVPLQGNEAARNLYLGAELNRLAAMEAARIKRKLTVTHVVTLAQGGDGLLAFQPLYHDERFDGFILGVFHVHAMLDRAIRQSDPAADYAVQIYDGERKIYSRNDAVIPAPEKLKESAINLLGVSWRVLMWPTPAFLEKQTSRLPVTVLAAGLFVALLLTLITLLVQLVREREYKLRHEIAGRQTVEEQNALLMSELQVVFENAVVGIAFIKDQRIVRCNRQFADILGYQVEDIVGQTVATSYPSEAAYQKTGHEIYAALEHGDSFNADLELRRSDGTMFWAACFGKAVDARDISKGVVWVLEDISERKAAENRLAHLAQHDPLTELPNRAMFADRLRKAISHAERHGHQVAVGYLDLDKFKFINDNYGHEAGDQLLVTISQRLLVSVRDTDTVARLGGDEFAIVLFDASETSIIRAVAERILAHIGKPVELCGEAFTASGSMGLAIYPRDGLDPETLLKHADDAMYKAKQLGRNNYQLYSGVVAGADLP